MQLLSHNPVPEYRLLDAMLVDRADSKSLRRCLQKVYVYSADKTMFTGQIAHCWVAWRGLKHGGGLTVAMVGAPI